jgi:ABC-type multidrug transport system ATPase subunit
MNEQTTTLRVENATKRYGDFTAVNDLSFEVKPGRVFGFLGPNGAGKTTTIRMIVGITAPDDWKNRAFRAQNHNRVAKPHRLFAGRARTL